MVPGSPGPASSTLPTPECCNGTNSFCSASRWLGIKTQGPQLSSALDGRSIIGKEQEIPGVEASRGQSKAFSISVQEAAAAAFWAAPALKTVVTIEELFYWHMPPHSLTHAELAIPTAAYSSCVYSCNLEGILGLNSKSAIKHRHRHIFSYLTCLNADFWVVLKQMDFVGSSYIIQAHRSPDI